MNKNDTEVRQGRSTTAKVVIALCVLIIVGALFAGVITVYNANFALEKATPIENIFVDVNGDGLQDYIRYAEVVINTGNLNLTQSP